MAMGRRSHVMRRVVVCGEKWKERDGLEWSGVEVGGVFHE